MQISLKYDTWLAFCSFFLKMPRYYLIARWRLFREKEEMTGECIEKVLCIKYKIGRNAFKLCLKQALRILLFKSWNGIHCLFQNAVQDVAGPSSMLESAILEIGNKAALQTGGTQVCISTSLTWGKKSTPALTHFCKGGNDIWFNEYFSKEKVKEQIWSNTKAR